MNNGYRRRIAAAGICAAAALGLATPAAAAEITLTYAFFAPAGTFPGKQMQHWADELSERTKGRVEVQTFPGGTLLGADDMYDGVRQGVVDIGLGAPTYDPGRFPLTYALSLPLGFESATAASRTYRDLVREFDPAAYQDYKVIALFTSEPSHIQSREPVRGLDDIAEMKLRAAGGAVDALDALGAAPVGMPMPAVPEAVQTGVIDGVLSSREILRDFKLAENLDYVTDYPMGVITFAAVMNKDRWDRLPEEVRRVIEELGPEMAEWTGRYHDADVDDVLAWARTEEGLEVVSLDAGERERWDRRLAPLVDAWERSARDQGLPAERFLERLRTLRERHESDGE
ncbi:TRAP transporter substrate-binding protein [Arhodomonas sp. SL1]|uniref:TRAP transporter substrate-binding protein n=1 Tax=Arhodomonas sp. SL1 TaxID=3425691 RepID=UPI003F880CED